MAPSLPTDYIAYADESGDHGLDYVDPAYPVFVLVFCIIRQKDYTDKVSPAVQRLKFKYFGHDIVVLHERKIRKKEGPFSILTDKATRESFMADVNDLVTGAPITLIASVIDKQRLLDAYGSYANNPYDLGLAFCLERLFLHLDGKGAGEQATRVVVERRGKLEDDALELEFRRVCGGQNKLEQGRGRKLPFEVVFAEKRVNSSGLQLADLVGRPIGRHVMDKKAPNRAYDIIKKKFRSSGFGTIKGYGLKVFPE